MFFSFFRETLSLPYPLPCAGEMRVETEIPIKPLSVSPAIEDAHTAREQASSMSVGGGCNEIRKRPAAFAKDLETYLYWIFQTNLRNKEL